MSKQHFLLAGLLPAMATAQITFTAADLPQAGDDWGLYTDSDGGTAFAATPPAPFPQTWNCLNAFDGVTSMGLEWSSASSVPGSSLFPTADLGIDHDGFSSFYASDPDGLYNLGGQFPILDMTITDHVTGQLILPVPFTYGNTRTYTHTYVSITVFDSGDPAMKNVVHGGGSFACDAFGTMMTPAYPSGTEVLRIVETRDATVDSTFIDMSGTGNGPWTYSSTDSQPGNTGHLFIRNGSPGLVADIGQDAGSATYYTATLPDAIAESGNGVRQLLAYPVPSTDDLVNLPVGGTDIRSMEVVNPLGEMVRRIGVQGTDVVHLGTGSLAPGTYQFRCLDEHGGVTGQGRFVVQH